MSDHDTDAAGSEPRRNLFEPAPVIDHQGDVSPPPVVVRRGGTPLWFTLLLTAGLGGAGYYGWTHPAPDAVVAGAAGGPTATQGLSARLDALEKRDGAVASEAATALARRMDDLSGRVDGVSGKVAQLEAQSAKMAEIAAQKAPPADGGAPAPDHTAQEVAGLVAQQEAADRGKAGVPEGDVKVALDAMDQRLSKLEAAAPDAKAGADVAALGDRVAKLEQAAGQPDAAGKAPAGDAAALASLGDRVGRLEQAVGQTDALAKAQAGDAATLASLSDRLGRLEQAAGQSDAAAKAQAGDAVTLAALGDRLGKLEQATGQIQAQDEAAQKTQATDSQTLAALDGRIGKLEQGAGQAQGAAVGAAKDATRAIQLEAAAAALQAGQPLGAVPGAPPALARYATVAPPTESELRADYPRVADAARAVSQPGTANRSFFDRALARLQQSVVVRQGDHVVVGDPAAGVLARAQTSVAAGDLKGAADTLGALSGASADAVKPWVSQVRALLEARAALAAMAAHG